MTAGDPTADIMTVEPSTGPLDVTITDVPGSKSIANRALACAALANGDSRLTNVPGGDDSQAMLECIDVLGAAVAGRADVVTIMGTGGRLRPGPVTLPTRLAGTTSRFITAMCALGRGTYTIDGAAPLRARPMAPLHDALAAIGIGVTPVGRAGHLPVMIEGVERRAWPGVQSVVRMRGDVSSQYVTALMLIAPYLAGGLRIDLTTPLISRPYVEMTALVMAAFDGPTVEVGVDSIEVAPGRYIGHDMVIEADASSASYPLAAAAICGGRVTVIGLSHSSAQGDARFADVLERMGCVVTWGAEGVTVASSHGLVGIEVDMADISDTVPTLAVVAAYAATPTRITGVGFIRHKESDRIGDLIGELSRLGVRADEEPDGMVIHPSVPHGGRVATHHDHRLAMSLALVGLRTPGVEIADPGVVSKSWPGYWTMLRGLATGQR